MYYEGYLTEKGYDVLSVNLTVLRLKSLIFLIFFNH